MRHVNILESNLIFMILLKRRLRHILEENDLKKKKEKKYGKSDSFVL